MKKNISFEEAISSLENNVKRLEGGDVSLDESLRVFEESVSLIKLCNEKLDTAESRVRMLIEDSHGTVDDVPFDVDDEA